MTFDSERFVALNGGMVSPVAPLRLMWALEERGVVFRIDRGDLVASPANRLTDADLIALRRWKPHCLAILASAHARSHQ